jgi:hypothetical protein
MLDWSAPGIVPKLVKAEQGVKSHRKWLIARIAARHLRRALLPHDLPQDAVPDNGVPTGQLEAADQAAHSFFNIGDGSARQVTAAAHGFEQHQGDALQLCGGGECRFLLNLGGFAVADYFVEAHSDGLSQIHGNILFNGRNADEEMRVAHLRGGQTDLLRTEQQRNQAGAQMFANAAGALLQALDRVFNFSPPHSASGNNQSTVGYGVSDVLILLGAGENVSRADCGTSFTKSWSVGIHHT